MKKFWKKYKWYILAFLIPLAIYTLFFVWKGCFSDKNILNADMRYQYQNLFQYLHDLLHGEATFPYSFSKGLGGGMYGTFFYYLASPFHLLVYFFDDIPLFLNLLVIFKLSLSGLTMYTFLNSKMDKEQSSLLIFSVAYALMGYSINYYVNIMWLDGILLAPILLMGIDKILNKKKDFLYTVILFYVIFSNYYIGYILTVFSIIYFGYSYYLKYENNWKKERKLIFHFFFITFLVGFMTSFILIPSGLELLSTIRISLEENKRIMNWNFLDLLAPNYVGFGNLVNPLNYHGFCIYSGTIMIPLLICYFSNKKIPKREKKATMIVYLFFLLPVIIPFFNRFWHLFTYPIGFNYRYSFLVTLFSILIAAKSLENLQVSKKVLLVYGILFFIFSISLGYASWVVPDYYVSSSISKVIVTVLFVILNLILLYKGKKSFLKAFLVLDLIVNLFWIGANSPMPNDSDYWGAKGKLRDFSNYCEENKRCETKFGYTMNDSLFANYAGVSVFLTTMNGRATSFLAQTSNYSYKRNFYVYHPDMMLDTILGVSRIELRYLLEGYDLVDKYSFEGVELYLQENPYALELAYLVSPNIKNFHSTKEGFFYLEELLNAMDDKNDEYIIKLPVQKVSDTKYILKKENKYPYLYIYGDSFNTLNGEIIQSYLMVGDDYGVLYDIYGDTLEFEFEEEVNSFEIYTIDVEKIKEFSATKINLEIKENTGSKIVGEIEVPNSATLFTSIPYEKGWTVKVDGKKVKNYEVLDTFLAIDLEEGYHIITFEYHIYGLKIGILISIISFIGLCFYEYKRKRSTIH